MNTQLMFLAGSRGQAKPSESRAQVLQIDFRDGVDPALHDALPVPRVTRREPVLDAPMCLFERSIDARHRNILSLDARFREQCMIPGSRLRIYGEQKQSCGIPVEPVYRIEVRQFQHSLKTHEQRSFDMI